jgi:hypothetical protein
VVVDPRRKSGIVDVENAFFASNYQSDGLDRRTDDHAVCLLGVLASTANFATRATVPCAKLVTIVRLISNPSIP